MKHQRGGTFVGFIVGVIVGLASALVVAVYVTKVPVPFLNKGQTRNADQDEAEAKKNKNWDPNAPLYGKNPAKAASDQASAGSAPAANPPAAPAAPQAMASSPAASASKAAAVVDKKPEDKKAELKPAVSADPLGDLAKARAASVDEPFVYFVQLGAYRTMEEAESQRAKLSLSGIETKISEREQSGRTVYRVRVGPFDKKEDGEHSKEKLDKAGLETALVRVQR